MVSHIKRGTHVEVAQEEDFGGKKLEPKMKELTEDRENTMMSFIMCTLYQIKVLQNQEGWYERSM